VTSWLKKLTLPQLVLLALLTVHTGWIGVHLTLVGQDRINPWKLGGYGMYTRPQAVPFYEVYLLDNPGDEDGEWVDDFDDWAFYEQTKRSTFHCEPFNPAAIEQFLDQNQDLVGSDIKIYALTTAFEREPIRLEPVYLGAAKVIWQDETNYSVEGSFCEDDPFAFEGSTAA
jgi:hypothetical protein